MCLVDYPLSTVLLLLFTLFQDAQKANPQNSTQTEQQANASMRKTKSAAELNNNRKAISLKQPVLKEKEEENIAPKVKAMKKEPATIKPKTKQVTSSQPTEDLKSEEQGQSSEHLTNGKGRSNLVTPRVKSEAGDYVNLSIPRISPLLNTNGFEKEIEIAEPQSERKTRVRFSTSAASDGDLSESRGTMETEAFAKPKDQQKENFMPEVRQPFFRTVSLAMIHNPRVTRGSPSGREEEIPGKFGTRKG